MPLSPSLPALPAARWARLGEAVRELAAPLVYPSTRAWLEATGRAIREGVGAAAVTVFGTDGRPDPSATSHPLWAAEAFATYAEALEAAGCRERSVAAGVACRRAIYGPAFEAIAATPYVQEFLPSVGAHDSLTVAAGTDGVDVRVVLNADDPARPFTPDDVAVARLLQPALAAGLAAERALGPARADLHALADRAAACAVYDADGRRLHLSAALDARLAREPRREAVLEALDAWARRGCGAGTVEGACGAYGRAVSAADGRRLHLSAALDARLAREPRREALLEAIDGWAQRGYGSGTVEGARGAYRLSVTRAQLGGQPARVVVVAAPGPTAGLTPRQAEVAALLAQRRSNREIAQALGISPHTARHHTEAVLRVLRVSDRRAVADALAERGG